MEFNIGSININNILYADDTILIADSEAKLQNLLNAVVMESEQNGLSINWQKLVCMVISKSLNTPPCNVTVNGDKLKQLDQFSYLGSLITQNSRSDKEIKRRVRISKSVFHSMQKVLTSRSINMCTKMRLLKCYVWSTLLYVCESWTQ